ncbi:OmpA family protein [Aquabacterium sp. J223]|uniref:OmpA family protein n=1 Tax=Aquabacterium sp. J223 TaxID=2898431 RepID=UPI0021AD9CC3|nr:OmpA family protein [Aquabacterium sp. J223]UUX97293.1 OmpA family protein [Aquabacterium sp. J223]
MTRPITLLAWLPWLLLVTSCSSPPKPPTVDESRRRPVNAAMAVDLQSCRSDLENTRILAKESVRSAEASSQAMARMVHHQQLLVRGIATNAPAQRNLLVPVLFAFGSTQVNVPDADATRIVDEARTAPLVVLRGRTDGTAESPSESAIARQRAAAVESWLVQSGVDRARIRTTWQPVGDHAADNSTPGGRALNRRVEIEIYRAAPIVTAAGAPDTTLAHRLASD